VQSLVLTVWFAIRANAKSVLPIRPTTRPNLYQNFSGAGAGIDGLNAVAVTGDCLRVTGISVDGPSHDAQKL